jgi:hypothetical protein
MGNALAGMASFFLLWVLSVIGAFAVVPSWAYTEPQYEEGVLTSGGRCMSRARLLLTLGCLVFWVCLVIGYALEGDSGPVFEFWQDHSLILIASLYYADILLIALVVFAWQARGSGKWILWIASPRVAHVSAALSLPAGPG